MKTRAGTLWIMMLLVAGGGLVCALVTVAQTPKATPMSDVAKQGVRLIMGQKNKEPLHCTEASFKAALNNCPKVAFKVHYKPKGSGAEWDDGTMDPKLFTGTEIDFPAKDTGGATDPDGAKGGAGGVHGTQAVSFGDTHDLQAFVKELVDEAP